MKKGFTLVELAIVLVIIGLLIGGILVAQSMIMTSKVNAQVRQIQQLDVAITNFQTKYASLPGDSTLFSNPGDNDEKIESASGVSVEYPEFSGESAQVWKHLQQGVGLFSDYTFDTTNVCGGVACDLAPQTLNLPPAKIENGVGILVGYDSVFFAQNANVYNIATFDSGTAIFEESGGGVSCADVLAIDSKIDDKVANTGNVLATNCGLDYSGISLLEQLSGISIKIFSQTTTQR